MPRVEVVSEEALISDWHYLTCHRKSTFDLCRVCAAAYPPETRVFLPDHVRKFRLPPCEPPGSPVVMHPVAHPVYCGETCSLCGTKLTPFDA